MYYDIFLYMESNRRQYTRRDKQNTFRHALEIMRTVTLRNLITAHLGAIVAGISATGSVFIATSLLSGGGGGGGGAPSKKVMKLAFIVGGITLVANVLYTSTRKRLASIKSNA